MTRSGSAGARAAAGATRIATTVAGAALGAGTTAGSALLLYTGQGFLATAGFLLAVSIAAAAAGIWVGVPQPASRAVSNRRRWFWVVLAFTAAGVFALLWIGRPPLRASGIGGALAVLLILAEPAYASGSLIAGLGARARSADPAGGGAVATMIGAAVGVLFATTMLIPNLEAPGVFFGTAALLALVGGIETARGGRVTGAEDRTLKRSAIITGVGDRGQIGFAVAQRFIAAGWRIVITGLSENVHERASELAAGGEVAAVQADLTDAAAVASVIDAARARYGRLDAVVNVAGGLTVMKPLAATEPDEWAREIQRNADTAYQVCRAALPLLREHGGSIINFASPAGQRAVRNLGAYSAAKAAVVALTRALALEEKPHRVRVNAIAPGFVDTDQNRRAVEGTSDDTSSRFVTRAEVAEVTLFLASPAASGISGETIAVLGDALD